MTEIAFAIEAIEAPLELEGRWSAVAAAEPPRFFLGWCWTSAWLAATGARPVLLRCVRDGSEVALAFLCRARGPWGTRVVALNETGEPQRDVGYVEYNGLAGGRTDAAIIDAAARYLLAARAGGPLAGWDELRLSGVSRLWADSFAAAGAWVTIRSEQRSFAVDLERLRRAGNDPLAGMNANTRQQIRRARRIYAAAGPVTLERIRSEAERDAALEELIALHQARWQAKRQPGAFASPVFRQLVQELVARGAPTGEVEMLRARAGTRTIGILLNLVRGGEVANYLGAFAEETDNRLKPGLVTHALAIEHHLACGSGSYDLLAGETRYKASLAAPREEMVWISVRPRTPRALVTAWLERARASVLRRLHASGRS